MLNRDCSKTKQSSSNNTIVLAVLILCINFVGIYSAEFEPSADTEQRCTNVTCPVVGTDTCDLDSTPVASESGLDECCTGREVCKCDYQKCHKNVPMECDEGYGRLLVTPGEGKPGKCCDQYQCKQLPDRCGGIQCPNFFAETLEPYGEDGKCPEDSYRPISYIPEGACCPIFPQ
jgi:hypothetical protein